jgi:hypothetical protein
LSISGRHAVPAEFRPLSLPDDAIRDRERDGVGIEKHRTAVRRWRCHAARQVLTFRVQVTVVGRREFAVVEARRRFWS